MKHKFELDETDWKILSELQANGRITNVELATKVGISAPPCLRRVKSLRENGFIDGFHARLNQKKLGMEVLAFAMVGLHRQTESDLASFTRQIEDMPEIMECHMLSGEIDFILKCATTDMDSFQNFIIHTLTAMPNVASVKTSLVIKPCKSECTIDLVQLMKSHQSKQNKDR